MFRFIVGPDDLSTADMECNWPNGGNPWWGVCQNAGTGSKVAELNASIQNCGWLIEPTSEVLPAGKTVLMVTSTDMCTASNSFEGLADTLIIIFQCSGNYTGHFANYNNSGNNLRTLEVNFGQPCEDIVTYNRSFLIDQSGMNLAADGARVDFTWAGAASYHNDGCNAPVDQATFDAGANMTLCPGETILLNGEASSDYSNFSWSGGLGTFSAPNSLNTQYTPSPDDPEEIILTLNADGCQGPITDEVTIFNISDALTGIDSQGLTAICDGSSLTLTAQGTGFFAWSTSVVAPSITVSTPGTYTVSVNNACGTDSESIIITETISPSVNISNPPLEQLCQGETVALEATGTGGPITWSTLETGTQITVSSAGWFYANVENECAIALDSVQVQVTPDPEVSISPVGPIALCQGASVTLTATGTGTFSWSNLSINPSITVSQLGTYSVQASNLCGSVTDEVELVFGGLLPVAAISASDLVICPGEMTILNGSGGETYTWNGVAADAELAVDEPGTYQLTASNGCGSDTESVIVSLDQIPQANLLNGPDFAICNGDQAQVIVSGTGTFQWSDGAIANSQLFSETGSYYVVADAACGTDTAYFDIYEENIQAQAFVNPLLGAAPLEVDFSNETSNAVTIKWIFGTGQNGFGEEVSHVYENEGNYTALLQVTSELGCKDEVQIHISVGACAFALYIPTAFTPDNDGVNDQLKVVGECIRKFEWHIFDRWGREIFFSEDRNSRWDGADVSGYAVLNGEYPYWVQVTDSNGETHRFNGSILLLR